MDCAPPLTALAELVPSGIPLAHAATAFVTNLPSAILADTAAAGRAPAAAIVAAAALCAVGLVLIMRPDRRGLRVGGTVLALAGFALLMMEALRTVDEMAAPAGFPPVFPVVFGLVAVFGAVRMITHTRPVFAALYFILVVIATAGLFLLLGAEFMAFSLIIVYAGAILITYMFVLMLAQQSPVSSVGDAWYDRMPREPVSAVVVGFIMLATLGDAFLSERAKVERIETEVASARFGAEAAFDRLAGMPRLLKETATTAYHTAWRAEKADEAGNEHIGLAPEVVGAEALDSTARTVRVELADGGAATVVIPEDMLPDNARQVGVDLVSRFPAGLEIAGVVLLMALFGAVILARRQIELGEDERRALAGMGRYSIDPDGSGGTR